ncbi:hypothetical protein GJ496_001725 [Pomphorhynchus laevis]|nr:hypothetical protein GJ496_001725 [Pomphorhynchus laevis]
MVQEQTVGDTVQTVDTGVVIDPKACELAFDNVDSIESTEPLISDHNRNAEMRSTDTENMTTVVGFESSPTKNMWKRITSKFKRGQPSHSGPPRQIRVGYHSSHNKFPSNELCNRKYNLFTFLPLVLFEQFSYFLNFYFLIMALSQLIPSVRVGYMYTYWGPLCFVLVITLSREAYDDLKRRNRDREVNQQKYKCWRNGKYEVIASEKLKVGDIVWVEKDQRVPADLVLLHCGGNGSCFLRTDQLDGETDWKLRIACHLSQQKFQNNALEPDMAIPNASIQTEPPRQNFDSFEGLFTLSTDEAEEAIGVENVLWASTVLATDQAAIGCILYTGKDCRMAMNTEKPRAKVGLLDLEINRLTKLLLLFVIILSSAMIILKGFSGPWYRYWYRYVLLFSYIIPLSLRVNLDLSKMVYGYFISKDNRTCPNTVVRSSTIPEELGRINVVLCDKTGTLTQNEMIFKKLHLGSMSFGSGQEGLNEIRQVLYSHYSKDELQNQLSLTMPVLKRSADAQVRDAIEAIALCHNVTPSQRSDGSDSNSSSHNYQAASPDEVCLVRFCEQVGITLKNRDLNLIELDDQGRKRVFRILHLFPFTSELKRMGIIVQEEPSFDNSAIFFVKGADIAIQPMVHYSDWLNEETGNLAREGLRILVYAKRILSSSDIDFFNSQYDKARLTVGGDRVLRSRLVVETLLERDMELLCITGVEDKLQTNARQTLESLKYAGIRVWMLTGDKRETAACIARSSRLFSRDQEIHWFQDRSNEINVNDYVRSELLRLQRQCSTQQQSDSFPVTVDDGPALVISGTSLHDVLMVNEPEFLQYASRCRSIVVCRCNPTQKADVVTAIGRQMPSWRIAAVGDGGNDVSMIQRAHAGIGIVGKEGRQASLAADFSISQFSYLTPLLLVHGRNCYKRSASIAQFVMHRGMLISIMQAVFSSIFYCASVSLYQGFLMVGYATVYTMFPVFSLVLDCDVSPEVALTYPEIYKEIQNGRSLNLKTFSLWLLISIYQGSSMIVDHVHQSYPYRTAHGGPYHTDMALLDDRRGISVLLNLHTITCYL